MYAGMGEGRGRLSCTAPGCTGARLEGAAFCKIHAAEERGRRRGLREAVALADEWAAQCHLKAEEAAAERDWDARGQAEIESEGAAAVAGRIRAFYLKQPPVGA